MDPLQGVLEGGHGDESGHLEIVGSSGSGFENGADEGAEQKNMQRHIRKMLQDDGNVKSNQERMLEDAKEESWTMLVKAHRRIQIEKLLDKGPPPLVHVNHIS